MNMFRNSLIGMSVCLLIAGTAPITSAETGTAQLMGDRLRAGQLKELRTDLSARLALTPADDQIRFALGATEFLLAVEHLSQSMYRYGLEPPPGLARSLPFFRMPVPHNPKPDWLSYKKMREVFKTLQAEFSAADTTLAKIGTGDVKLPIAIGLARLDLNGDGNISEDEALWRVFNATLGGGNIPEGAADQFIISFDRGDVAWLRGYTHLLGAILDFVLAHDWQDGFDSTFHMIFPNAGLPNAVLDDYRPVQNQYFDLATAADVIAFIHLMHWPVAEPERMKSALSHLESVVGLSRESWKYIQVESDDEAEWIPGPKQNNGVLPGAMVSQQTVDGWMEFLDEFEAVLKGDKLIPHWRLAKGINLRRVFTEPRTFDPILWAQGSAALPYVENGPMTTAETWNRITRIFGGNFLGYAIWFN
ncbi:MAG TPA: hypothetical protein VF224_15970 [Aestuariivirga sp.]